MQKLWVVIFILGLLSPYVYAAKMLDRPLARAMNQRPFREAAYRALKKIYQKSVSQSAQRYAMDNYSIHLMWINESLNPHQKYIYPTKSKKELREKLLDPVERWALVNPHATVNLWYDGDLTPSAAVANTQERFEAGNIVLKDIRTLPLVDTHKRVFSDETPVYFRVDLIRIIIAVYLLENARKSYCVFADLDVEILSAEELFDDQTMHNLEAYGVVMAEHRTLNCENSFHIISNNKKNLLESMKRLLIELNIERAYMALDDKFHDIYRDIGGPKALEQIIYESYSHLFLYFYHLEGLGVLEKKSFGRWRLYDEKKDGLAFFGLDHVREIETWTPSFKFTPKDPRIVPGFRFVPIGATKDMNEFAERKFIESFFVPTKKVKIPLSRFYSKED